MLVGGSVACRMGGWDARRANQWERRSARFGACAAPNPHRAALSQRFSRADDTTEEGGRVQGGADRRHGTGYEFDSGDRRNCFCERGEALGEH